MKFRGDTIEPITLSWMILLKVAGLSLLPKPPIFPYFFFLTSTLAVNPTAYFTFFPIMYATPHSPAPSTCSLASPGHHSAGLLPCSLCIPLGHFWCGWYLCRWQFERRDCLVSALCGQPVPPACHTGGLQEMFAGRARWMVANIPTVLGLYALHCPFHFKIWVLCKAVVRATFS